MSMTEVKQAMKAKTSIELHSSSAIEKKKINVPTTMQGLKTTQIKDILALYSDQIAQAVPKHLTSDRIIQIVTTLISRTPTIAKCTTESIIGAVLQASILGFEPVAALGQCYFVPFYNKKSHVQEVQFIMGYRGMIDLAMRTGLVASFSAHPVYSNDKFDYELGLHDDLIHKPAINNRGEFIFAYSVCRYKEGGYSFYVMSKDDIEKIRRRSKASDSEYSPWSNPDDYPAMAMKTAVRQLFKFVPTSISRQTLSIPDEAVLTPAMFECGELKEEIVNEYIVEESNNCIVGTSNIKPQAELEQPTTTPEPPYDPSDEEPPAEYFENYKEPEVGKAKAKETIF